VYSRWRKQLGYFDRRESSARNLCQPSRSRGEETYAYSLEEINAMLTLFPEPASTAFCSPAFAGLRRGEVEGLYWFRLPRLALCGFPAAFGMRELTH